MPMNCETARTHLLDHVYGALDDEHDAALREHLAGCETCAAQLTEARGQRDLFAAAARTEATGLALTPPRRVFTLRRVAAAAAVLVVAAGATFAWRQHRIATAEALNPHVAVVGPSIVAPGEPAEFLVDVKTLGGDPIASVVCLEARPASGGPVKSAFAPTDENGRARVVLDPGAGQPGEQVIVDITVQSPGNVTSRATTVVVRDGSHLLARVATDKPLYRPGEPIRVRAVALERMKLVPAGDVPMLVTLIDPRGGTVNTQYVQSRAGVGACELGLSPEAPGGEYKVVLAPQDATRPAFPATEQKFVVRAYRVPRLKSDIELDRDSYGPGDAGTASLTVERAEGGVPDGAELECVVTVDGKDVSRETQKLPASGAAKVRFALPKDITEGTGQVTVIVKDGGSIETVAKTIPIALGRLDVAFFPEGGDLVAGLANRVYFEVKEPKGEPADLVADVVDETGAKVAEARVDDVGMGRFDLTPRAGAKYRLVATKPAGIQLSGDFPAVASDGVTLRALDDVTAAGRPIRVEITARPGGRHTIAAYCRGALIAQDSVDLAPGERRVVELKPTSDVGGVVRVTVFDGDNQPRAERLVSLTPPHRIDLDVKPAAASYSPGDRVKVEVTSRDETGRAVAAILGAYVVDDSVVKLADDEDTPNFPLHFLLGLEVEELEKADAYAKGPNASRAIDRLLGVQGWRRFAWKAPTEFLAKHPVAGARVTATEWADAPQHLDNGSVSQSMVASTRRSVDRTLRRIGTTGGAGLAFVVVIVALVTGAGGPRAKPFLGAALVCGVLVAVVAVTVPTMQASREDAPMAAAPPPSAPRPSAWARPLGSGPQMLYVPGEVDIDGATIAPGWGPSSNALFGATSSGVALAMPRVDGLGRNSGDALTFRDPIERLRRLGYMGGEFAEEVIIPDALPGRVGEVWTSRWPAPSRVYAHRRQPTTDGTRSDFTEVLYWNPLLVTDADGKARFEFDTSDSVTTFTVGVDAHDTRGALGTSAAPVRNRVPFYVEPKLPVALSAGDVLRLPVVVANDTDAAMDVGVDLEMTGGLLTNRGAASIASSVAAGVRGRVLFDLVAGQGQGSVGLTFGAKALEFADRSTRTIPIQPRGYPIDIAKAGVLEKRDAAVVHLPADLDRTTLIGGLRLYPSTLASIEDGIEAMLQEPHGCFEQVSSTTYPNVLVLQYLEATNQASPATVRRAKELLATGYEALAGYECDHHGFEWWGKDPGHLALSAYGLAEFADMAKVRDVDPSLIARTREWLLAKRKGDGTFEPNGRTVDHFGQAPDDITDAYCTWAILDADPAADMTKEVAKLVERATKSDDPYMVALAAGAAAKRRLPEAAALLDRLASMQKADGRFAGKTTSITSSVGINLDVETTALAALAFVTDTARLPLASKAAGFLIAQRRSGGSFGATQATVLALRALVEHAKASKHTASDHDIAVTVNGKAIGTRHVASGAAGAIVFDREFLDALVPGENRIEFTTTGTETLPWAVAILYHANLPASDPDCAIGVETKLAKDSVAEGETVRLDVTLTNRTQAGVATTIARIGLPAGLEPREDQLKEMKKSGAVDSYETRPREVTLYLNGMAPSAVKRIALDLVAAIPGEFEGPATSAYLYYGDDRKTWAAPLRCMVAAAR